MTFPNLTRRPIVSTPWGACQSVTNISPDVSFYSTASHGGYLVVGPTAAKIRKAFPGFVPFTERHQPAGPLAAAMRHAEQGAALWLEEDCDWAALALVAPELFPPAAAAPAERLRAYITTGRS